MAAQQNVRGYLTYMARQGCGGCQTFSSRVLPALKEALPGDVALVVVTQPQYDSISTPLRGYETLSVDRPAIEFPMLAWSQEDPKYAQSFKYLQADKMGKVSNIIAWLDQNLSASTAQTQQVVQNLYAQQQAPSLFYPPQQQNTRSLFDSYY